MSLSCAQITYAYQHAPADYRMALRWQYPGVFGGDGFFDLLLKAAAHADLENLALIEEAFPAVGEAVRRWKNEPGYSDAVERWAREHTPAEAEVRQ